MLYTYELLIVYATVIRYRKHDNINSGVENWEPVYIASAHAVKDNLIHHAISKPDRVVVDILSISEDRHQSPKV